MWKSPDRSNSKYTCPTLSRNSEAKGSDTELNLQTKALAMCLQEAKVQITENNRLEEDAETSGSGSDCGIIQ